MLIRSFTSVFICAALMLVPAGLSSHIQSATTSAGTTVSLQFDHDGDNEWWVEVLVRGAGGDHAVTVEARAEGGAYHHLQHKALVGDWHKWGTNTQDQFRIPPGARVQFRAFVADGVSGSQFVESCLFTHPAGLEQCGTTTPQPTTFDATFTGVRGNEWWIQAKVATNGPAISRVDVTLDRGATYKPLAKQDWGGWAVSTRIVQGTVVQLRATAVDGRSDLSSCRQWIPPPNTDATIVSCGTTTPTGFDASFSGVKGNEWWVEAKVTANRALSGVDARVNCAGAWKPMTLRSWGNWAASFQIPSGSKVDLRARATDGSQDLSGGYIWPAATATSACPAAPPPDRFVGPASSSSITVPFQLDASSAGSGRVGTVEVTDNLGSISFLGRAWPVVAYVRIPWTTYGDLMLYQLVSVQADGFMVFYLYCRSGQMTHVWFEGANGPVMSNERVTGTCAETLGQFATPTAFPASNFELTRRITNYRITGTDLNYDGTTWGRIRMEGAQWQWWPFMEVDCSTCEANGFYELHSLMRDPATGRVAFGIVYMHEESPNSVSLHYGLRWAPTAFVSSQFYSSSWTRT